MINLCIQYKINFLILKSPVSKVTEPPNDTAFEFTVIELFASLSFAIEPANTFVTPDALT